MLRITHDPGGSSTIIRFEGALRGPWVEEARSALAANGIRPPLLLDLRDVTYADEAGLHLLRETIAGGARLLHISSFLAAALGLEDR